MSSNEYKRRPPPTDAARLAAVAKRRETAGIVKDKARPDVFVVRRETPGGPFGWEIRRFGSVVIARSEVDFATVEEATSAGRAALDRHLTPP